jgi:predicted enzyme related to lactoylglutathione lyase
MDMHRAVPILTVSDLQATAAEYRRLLGLDVLMDQGWIVTMGSRDGAQLSLITRDATAAQNPMASLDVDDVDAAYEQAVEDGVEIVHPLTEERWGVRRFFFRDSAGNIVNVLTHN